jgi:hypothetical protein
MTTVKQHLDDISKIQSKYFIDIGASCSTEHSQSEVLLELGFSGLMFECDTQKFPIQFQKMMGKNVIVSPEKVTVDNILHLLESNNVPDGFYLTIDIDGYDYFVLDKILSKYKPQLIVSEINEKIPAGVKFTVEYDNDYFWDGSHYYGYSLSMLSELLEKYGYRIEELDYNNVILTPGLQVEDIKDVYERGYLNRPERKSMFYYNADFEIVYSLPKEQQLDFIRNKFLPTENERQSRLGHQIDGKKISKRNFILY